MIEYGARGSMLHVKGNTDRQLERKHSNSDRNNEIERVMAKYELNPV